MKYYYVQNGRQTSDEKRTNVCHISLILYKWNVYIVHVFSQLLLLFLLRWHLTLPPISYSRCSFISTIIEMLKFASWINLLLVGALLKPFKSSHCFFHLLGFTMCTTYFCFVFKFWGEIYGIPWKLVISRKKPTKKTINLFKKKT